MISKLLRTSLLSAAMTMLCAVRLSAQPPSLGMHGDIVPRDVREMYERGLQFLVATQTEKGDWPGPYQGPGTTGMALMAFLSSGEDPNFGIYSSTIRKAVKSIVTVQNSTTGILGDSMYQHGFAMLGMAEAYGSVDDRQFWNQSGTPTGTSLGKSLELAVRAAITSQKKNPFGAWRYSPDATDADTSVSGAVLVGLLAARNAGIQVPDEAIDRAISYFKSMTSDSGQVAYSGGMGGFGESTARTAIASLVFSVGRRKDFSQFQATLKAMKDGVGASGVGNPYQEYADYYQSQALFQGDMESWEKWNRLLVNRLKGSQLADGSFSGQLGPSVSTSLSLLALALNYRFLPIYER